MSPGRYAGNSIRPTSLSRPLSVSQETPGFYQFGEHETLVFIKEVLDKVEVDYQNIDLLGRN